MKLRSTIILLASFAAHSAPADPVKAPASSKSGVVSVSTYGGLEVWRVNPDGSKKRIKLPEDVNWGGGSGAGTSSPLPSPDYSKLAYIHKGSLVIRNLSDDVLTTVVSGYPADDLCTTAWSLDGGKIIYYLGVSQQEEDDEDTAPRKNAPKPKVTEPKHFLHDLKSKASSEIDLGGELVAWAPGGELIIWNAEKGTLAARSLDKDSKPRIFSKQAKDLGQFKLSPDGSKLLCVNSVSEPSLSQVLTVDLATGKTEPVSEKGTFADIQWPAWSPSGKLRAWLRGGLKNGERISSLIVEGKAVSDPAQIMDYLWVDETSLVLQTIKGEKTSLTFVKLGGKSAESGAGKSQSKKG